MLEGKLDFEFHEITKPIYISFPSIYLFFVCLLNITPKAIYQTLGESINRWRVTGSKTANTNKRTFTIATCFAGI